MKYIKKYMFGLALAFTASSSHASSFSWDNSVLSTHVASDGSVLSTSFTFAIGGLGAGFDFADPTTWISNFNALDTDTYNETGFNEIGATAIIADSLTIGEQPYIFGYSTEEGFGLPGSEGVLFTSSNWNVFPDPNVLGLSEIYSVAQVTDVVFGSVIGNPDIGAVSGSNLGSFTHGFDGEQIEANPVPVATELFPDFLGPVEIQTFGFTAIPEPSVAVLGLFGTLAFFRRRRA